MPGRLCHCGKPARYRVASSLLCDDCTDLVVADVNYTLAGMGESELGKIVGDAFAKDERAQANKEPPPGLRSG